MRGIYRRGSIYWLARQVDNKRHFVSLETSDRVEALGRAEKIRTEGVLESGTILCHTVERYIRYCRGSPRVEKASIAGILVGRLTSIWRHRRFRG